MPSGFFKADTIGSLSGTNAWTEFKRNYYAPASALTAQFYLECNSDTAGVGVSGVSGTAWFDNLSFAVH